MANSRHSGLQIDCQYSRMATRIIGLLLSLSIATLAFGHDVDVVVVDKGGHPVADVAVYALRLNGKNESPAPTAVATMDQVDRQFVPHLLVVQTGTPVEFPNSDTVAHHVYSFSHPNKFMLPMYKGKQYPPVIFQHSGVVSLGCNIHDHMLGYILVVDSADFTMTDENGHAILSLNNPAEYAVKIWSPRIRDKEKFLTRSLASTTKQDAEVVFSLAKRLNPPHDEQAGGASWSDY